MMEGVGLKRERVSVDLDASKSAAGELPLRRVGSAPRISSPVKEKLDEKLHPRERQNAFISRSFSNLLQAPHSSKFLLRQQGLPNFMKFKHSKSSPMDATDTELSSQIPETLRISSHSLRGTKHMFTENEDTLISIADLFSGEDNFQYTVGVFGVFDGHGGTYCSRSIAAMFPSYIKQSPAWETLNQNPSADPTAIEVVLVSALEYAFEAVSKEFLDIAKERQDHSGSCALIFVVCNGIIVTANAGDSKGIVFTKCGDRKSVRSTARHHVNNMEEVGRVIEAGGSFHQGRLLGCLLPTRAFGNLDCHENPHFPPDVLISRPQIQVVKLQRQFPSDEAALLLASDGLWDFVNQETVIKVLMSSMKKQSKQLKTINIAETLTHLSIRSQSEDDVTVIVVMIK